MIFHIIRSEDWTAAEDPYSPVDFSRDGFIHCSYSWQVERVVNEHFPNVGRLLALELDYRAFLPNEIRSEDLTHSGEDFPHVYAPIARAAIRSVHELGSDGSRDIRFEPAHPLFDRLSSNFRVRRALGDDDVTTLALFRHKMFAELHPEQADEIDPAVLLAKTEDYFRRHAFDEGRASFVLCADREVVGGATLIVEEKAPRPGRMPNLDGYVRDVYVLPDYRGKGGARLIMTMIREEAARRKIGKLALHASEMGRPIYSSIGYKPNSAYLELEDVFE
jgi:uncharacterized protein (DUF952 family)/GNAT superfamily N-acetyltransferase